MNKTAYGRLIQQSIFFFSIAIIIGIFAYHFYHHPLKFVDRSKIVNCTTVGKTYHVEIEEAKFIPEVAKVRVCDRVEFINKDKRSHQVAFGSHPYHLLYPGFKEKLLKTGEKNDVVLSVFGNYSIHDHIYDEIEGEIIVSK